MVIITENPVKKNGPKFTEELLIVVWRPIYATVTTGLQIPPDWYCFHLQYFSAKPAEVAESLIAQLHSLAMLT
jgi:hypothetical protein